MTVHTHSVLPFDSRDFRRSLGKFGTGVTVITTRAVDGRPIGFTANSFASVSLEPPLVSWNLAKTSSCLAHFESCNHYAINVLAEDQIALSQLFATTARDKFASVSFDNGVGSVPLLPGCCAWFECVNESRYPGGDHLIFVGRVERFSRAERPPLLFHGGHYCVAERHPKAPERR